MTNCEKCEYAIWSFLHSNGESIYYVDDCELDKEPEDCEEE